MSFFQNPFYEEFRGSLVLGDRQFQPTFKVRPNAGRGPDYVVPWVAPNYDLSGNDGDANDKSVLTLRFALDSELFKNWSTITVDIGGATVAATTAAEIVTILNANATFSSWFTASLDVMQDSDAARRKIIIRQKFPNNRMKFYVVNTGAETVLRFNARAGVAELPTYFKRHGVGNDATGAPYRFNFNDAQNCLVEMDVSKVVDQNVIDNATDYKGASLGYSYLSVSEDYELLQGSCGLFEFTNVVDANNTIIYPAGAGAGDLAKKIITNSGNTFAIPYVLAAADLITPP